jgi:hypothetical protein
VSTAQPEAGYSGAMAGILVQDPFNSELTVADRCDRCSAQAYVRVAHGTWPSELLFCAHHGSKHVPALQDIEGIWVHDERDRLYAETALMKQASTEV